MEEERKEARKAAMNRLMAEGVGNSKSVSWTNESLSKISGVSTGVISQWRSQGGTSRPDTTAALRDTFFPDGQGRDPYYREYAILFAGGVTPETDDIDVPIYSSYDVWKMLLRPIRPNTSRIITEAKDKDERSGLFIDHLSSTAAKRSFFVPVPNWFHDWAHTPNEAGYLPYDVNEPSDFTGDPELSDIRNSAEGEQILDSINHHAERYAREVHKAHNRLGVQFPPYNKPKIGVLGWRQPVRAQAEERAYLTIEPYITDYFTDRVMRGVLADLRHRRPDLFANITDYPMRDGFNLAYFATSLGLNIVLITDDGAKRQLHMSVLSQRIGNPNQRERLHITANEAANVDDLDAKTNTLNYRFWLKRSLLEELGLDFEFPSHEDDLSEPNFLEFSFEMTNYEPFLSCVVYSKLSREEFLRSFSSNARDGRREIEELRAYDFERSHIINMLVKNERGTNGFTTYSPLILDLILSRGLAA